MAFFKKISVFLSVACLLFCLSCCASAEAPALPADGSYTPDSFTFSGGSGRVRIVCDRIEIQNGKAQAVIAFVSTSGKSTSYSYVKVGGQTYYPEQDGSFVIPVTLNANNEVIGMTTKMSAAHEITYTIYPALGDSRQIPGLTFLETVNTGSARYLKLYQFENGVYLAEIPGLSQDEAAPDAALAADSTTDSEEEEILSDFVAALYRANTLRYLLVPEGTELPAGLEKEYLIVNLPISHTLVLDESLLPYLASADALDTVGLIGCKENPCQNSILHAEHNSIAYGGTWEKPNYRAVIRAKTDLALVSSQQLLDGTPEGRATLADRFAVLGIPLLLDRSGEEDAEGSTAWQTLYNLIFQYTGDKRPQED